MGERTPIGFGGHNTWSLEDGAVNLVRPAIPPRPARLPTHTGPDIVVDFARAALVVVDMQNDFLHPDGWFAGKGIDVAPLHAVVPPINRLSGALRAANVPVIWLNWGVRADGLNLPPTTAYAGKRHPGERGYTEGGALVKGSWGAAFHDRLKRAAGDVVVEKSRLGGFRDSELDGVLRNLRRHTLFFAGINIDRCVFATLTEATFAGYDAVLIEDAVASPSPAHCAETVHFLTDRLYGFRAATDAVVAAAKTL
ncbi:MAG: isochorismatase family cysteine hydrolase [Pseudomonadota bacterium]